VRKNLFFKFLRHVEVVSADKKLPKFLNLLKTLEGKLIIFTLYKKSTNYVLQVLENAGYGDEVAIMHGDLNQAKRESSLKEFHMDSKRILLTTDVCARGMDIKKVKYVVNYEYPLTTEDYVHRIGRTGRAKETGVSYTFFDPVENKPLSRELVDILKEANQEVPKDLQDLADKTFARPVRSYTDKLYGGKYEYVTDKKSSHIKF
jgi:superfamily II DNA/RNA helicase